MKFERSMSQVLRPLTNALPAGATEQQPWHSPKLLEDVITAACMDWSQFVPIDAPPFQLSISVTVIGEQNNSESPTSTEQPGIWSPPNHVLSASSQSPSAASEEQNQQQSSSSSLTLPLGWDPKTGQHAHVGNPFQNCKKCLMPFGANQHRRLVAGEYWPITIDDELDVETEEE